MKRNLIVRKCKNCGALAVMLKDCTCDCITCCEEKMTKLSPNSVDASFEKHVPQYQRVEDEIYVTVNHVMEKEHYIEWIKLVADNIENTVYLYPEQDASCRFKYIPGSTIYAYCNKHELWKMNVE